MKKLGRLNAYSFLNKHNNRCTLANNFFMKIYDFRTLRSSKWFIDFLLKLKKKEGVRHKLNVVNPGGVFHSILSFRLLGLYWSNFLCRIARFVLLEIRLFNHWTFHRPSPLPSWFFFM